ncbi:MAG: DUF4199 domain-containing protein [Bacteroidota bacterium]
MQKNTTLKNAMTYGIYGGIGLIVLFIIVYLINPLSGSPLFLFLNMFIIGMASILGVQYCRDKINNGFISYGSSLKNGVLIGVFVGAIFGVFSFIFYKFIDPLLYEKVLTITKEGLMKNNPKITDEQLSLVIKTVSSPFGIVLASVIDIAIRSFFIMSVVSFFIKRKNASLDHILNQ